MPVPTSIADCNVTASNNSPAGTDSIGTNLDDYLRAHAAILRQVYDASLIPSGTKMPFAQSSAPTGWTQLTTDNEDNRMLRVVKTAGGSVAGSHSPILNNVVPSHTHTVYVSDTNTDHTHNLTTSYAGEHSHSYTIRIPVFDQNGWNQAYTAVAGSYSDVATTTGAAGGHTHTGTTASKNSNVTHAHSASTDGGSSSTNWTPRYVDMIICSKN